MKTVFIILGFLLGGSLADLGREPLGLIVGALVGWLMARVIELQRRIKSLEQGLPAQPDQATRPTVVADETPSAPTTAAWDTPADPEPQSVASQTAMPELPVNEPDRADHADQAPTPEPRGPSRLDLAWRAARRWLTTGNIPVKLGVIISFFGVAFLFKFAIDKQLVVLPIEVRLLAVALAGIGVLIFGWRLRSKMPVYGLTLQGGGVGVMYLTIFAAFRLYEVLPSAFAFVLLIVLTVSAGVLAVIQNAKALAILGIAGGFLAPVLISTGGGSHVGLFSYYLLLNLAILAIALYRSWQELNLVGFVFTFTIGGLWGYRTYEPAMFSSTEPFLILFFVLYQAIAVIFALKQAPRLRGIVDGTLVFGTPVIAFAMQAVLLQDSQYGLAISALVLAVAYTIAATLMLRSRPDTLRILAEAYIALAIAFATLAIPLALDARWTAGAWAMEGAALIWIGMRQGSLLSRAAGVALIGAAGIAFGDRGWQSSQGLPGLNGNVLGGALISLAAFFGSRHLGKEQQKWAQLHGIVAVLLLVWGMGWWLWTGLLELDERLDDLYKPAAITGFLAASVGLLLLASRRFAWREAAAACFVLLPLLLIPAGLSVLLNDHPAEHFGWLAWLAAAVVQLLMLRQHEQSFPRLAFCTHALAILFLAGLLVWEAGWLTQRMGLNSTWVHSAMTLVPGLLIFFMLYWRRWPVAANWTAYNAAAGCVLVAVAILMSVELAVGTAGVFTPLPYVPLLNPLDLVVATNFIAVVAWLLNLRDKVSWLSAARYPSRMNAIRGIVGIAALVVSSMMLLRAAHHFGGVVWDDRAMFNSVLVQAALSIYWGLLALIAMIVGTKTERRVIWLAGAALMAVVVIKLFVVELGNSGTVARIVSFIGIGILLLIIGYVAPAPPRLQDPRTQDSKPDVDTEAPPQGN